MTHRTESEASNRPETLIPVERINELPWIPARKTGKKPHRSFWYRAMDPGIRGVKLQHVCVGKLRCTTETWLWRFVHALAKAKEKGREKPTPGLSRARREILKRNGLPSSRNEAE